MSADYRICIVCSGNICRSPMGEIVLREQLERAGLGHRVAVDSAGTGAWHVGDGADGRAVAALTRGGYDGSRHRARAFDPAWLSERNLVLAADGGHLHWLRRLATAEGVDHAEIRLLREFDPAAVAAGDLEVDDPYYGGRADFDRCLAEVEAACAGVVAHVRDQLRR